MEFALILPSFLLIIFATIDFGGYFGSRLSVENAARAGARVAAIQPGTAYPSAGTAIVTAISGQANVGHVSTTVDCQWHGITLTPTYYPPFSLNGGSSCIGIWYFTLQSAGPPSLCAQWSVASHAWDTWTSAGTETTGSATPQAGQSLCATAADDVVVVAVGYTYSPLTPMPSIATGALTTYGETELPGGAVAARPRYTAGP